MPLQCSGQNRYALPPHPTAQLPGSLAKATYGLTDGCWLSKLTPMEGLGAYIRKLRDERDLSLREFAKKLDVSAPFISDIELGRRHPSEEVLAKIAKVLGVKVEDLRARDTRPPIDEIKRITQSDPKFALAFRTMIDKKITAEDLLELAKKKGEKASNKPKK